MSNLQEYLKTYSAETKAVLEKIRTELNEDSIFSQLESNYNMYDLLMFNEFTIQDRLERLSYVMKDLRLKFIQEQQKVNQIKDRLDKVTGEKYIELKNSEVSLTKTEIERYYLPRDEEILQLKGLLRKQELRMNYFEACWDAASKLQWNIKLYIDSGKDGY